MKLTDINNKRKLPVFLNKNNLIDSGAEIGVRYGTHANRILRQWKGSTLFLIDIWPNFEIKNTAIEKLKEFKDKCRFIHKSSIAASEEIPNNSLDFCYLDASHEYNDVKEDINAWWPKVKLGGVFCGHDYSCDESYWISERKKLNKPYKPWPNTGVAKAVDEFVSEKNLIMHIDDGDNDRRKVTSWYITSQ
jgi:hypothetical protein